MFYDHQDMYFIINNYFLKSKLRFFLWSYTTNVKKTKNLCVNKSQNCSSVGFGEGKN